MSPLFAAGKHAGLLKFDSEEDAFRSFFGLVVADTQIRLLLGEEARHGKAETERMAVTAADRFLALFG
ncbi:MAG: TetR/AcrR family transcriptional regulator C-terminal domain-containing protein [Nitratireductor sp.]